VPVEFGFLMPLDLKKVSILVVEDLHPMRSLLVSILDAFGVGKIYEASNGERAFQIFQSHNPDIIITDWLMEPVDGIELIQMIRRSKMSSNPLVPIIVITGYSAHQRVTTARDLGATEFLTKPFSGRDLAKRVNHIVNRPRDFVETEHFFGPDRRRKRGDDYGGPKRREGEGSGNNWYLDNENSEEMPWNEVIK
jgi:two-component system chemotaxis response regulator CheY